GAGIGGEVGRAVGVGDAFAEGGVGVNHAGGDVGVAGLESGFEGLEGGVDSPGGAKGLRGPAPDHDQAVTVVASLELADVLAQHLSEFPLAGALFDIGAVQPFDIVFVK